MIGWGTARGRVGLGEEKLRHSLAFGLCCWWSLASSCGVLPYEAGYGRLPSGEYPADAFARVCDAVRVEFPELAEADEEAFRIQSAWTPHQRHDSAVEARVSLWRERDVLRAVVELRVLQPRAFGVPEWGGVEADPAWERRILDRAIEALEGR